RQYEIATPACAFKHTDSPATGRLAMTEFLTIYHLTLY
ncbi:unnamed protein product, partial [marine sediment metagenome]